MSYSRRDSQLRGALYVHGGGARPRPGARRPTGRDRRRPRVGLVSAPARPRDTGVGSGPRRSGPHPPAREAGDLGRMRLSEEVKELLRQGDETHE